MAALPNFDTPGPSDREGLYDENGHPVQLPDDVVFAASAVSYAPGSPDLVPSSMNPEAALGRPDYAEEGRVAPGVVTLGYGGSLVLRFEGGGLGDAPGPNLFVFEIGSPEPVQLSVSDDGRRWRTLGIAPGGQTAIDIAPWVKQGESFHYVRLQDVTTKRVFTHFPGADIDAVGVRQGTLQRYTVSSAVLFAFDDARLSADAPAALEEALQSRRARPAARVTVVGHADAVGTEDYNRALSQRRARSVADYLMQRGVAPERVTVRGAGADEPLAPNDTEEHRQQNRRVEITVDGR